MKALAKITEQQQSHIALRTIQCFDSAKVKIILTRRVIITQEFAYEIDTPKLSYFKI